MKDTHSANLRQTYEQAKSFLLAEIPDQNPATILDHYINLSDGSQSSVSLPELYQRLLFSAQNSNMKAAVIGGSIGGVERLDKVLYHFDPVAVVKAYGKDSDRLLVSIMNGIAPRGKVRQTPKSLWPKYCRTALSAAQFFSQYPSGNDFYEWANHFYQDPRSMPALPMILAEEIYGMGYPLSCDFLKELGFVNYGKPDVHIKEIFKGIGLSHGKPTDYEYQKIIGQIAVARGVSAYNVDKLFWLIGSGKFYDHPSLGKQGNIGRRKKQFMAQFRR